MDLIFQDVLVVNRSLSCLVRYSRLIDQIVWENLSKDESHVEDKKFYSKVFSFKSVQITYVPSFLIL